MSIPIPVAVIGGGVSGQAAMDLLVSAGTRKSDLARFDAVPGRGEYSDPAKLLAEFKPRTLVVSPGVPLSTPWIRDFGGVVTSELELACTHLEHEKVVGVTGSVGKSTTVSLLGEGAKRFCPDVFVGGNLGTPLARYAADVLSGNRPRTDWVILELSSFQLEAARNLRCVGSALTSLMRNHLERYADLAGYYDTKWKLVAATEGPVVLNEHGGDLKDFAAAHPRPGIIWASGERSSLSAADFARAKLVGAHNRDNLAVAAALARACAWPETFLDGMCAFAGLPHRLQAAGEHSGVRFINDSKATAIESVLTAIEAVRAGANGRVWVLLGGKDKKLPWRDLARLKHDARCAFAFFGQCGALAKSDSGLPGTVSAKLIEAMRSLQGQVRPGDVVLLSPGGSSLDEFKNFEERGQYFMERAKEIFS